MTLEESITTHLKDDAGVTALVAGRVYPLKLPQDSALPAISYQRISGNRISSASGDSGAELARMQVDIWAGTYREAKQLATVVHSAMDQAANTDGFAALLFSDRDLPTENQNVYRVSQDYRCFYPA